MLVRVRTPPGPFCIINSLSSIKKFFRSKNTSFDNWMTGDLKPDILLLNNCFKCFRISGAPWTESGQRICLSDPFKSITMLKE